MSGTFHSPGLSSLWLSTTCRDDIAHTKSGSGERDNEEEHGTLLELCVASSRFRNGIGSQTFVEGPCL